LFQLLAVSRQRRPRRRHRSQGKFLDVPTRHRQTGTR
jgi:hypothetical protein